MNVVKQSVGIDIAKMTFTACICKRRSDQTNKLSEVREFTNDKKGFNQFVKWVGKVMEKDVTIIFAMEATGIYYEELAYHLDKLKKEVSVILPNKVSHYSKSLNVKTKNDIIDAKIIAMMSCERRLFKWTPPSALFKKLRSVCRLYKTLQDDKTKATNRLKQLSCGYEPLKEALTIHRTSIKRITKELKNLEGLMEEVLRTEDEVWSKVEKLLTIKGIGLKTIAIVLGETQGFALIRNQRQLTSYCGYDVVQRESGTSIKGKTRISKKGNSHIRAALYFPSMVAVRYNPNMKEVYDRIVERSTIKKIGLVSIQRRLLTLIYSMWKSNEAYIENYEKNKISGFQEEEVSSSSSTRRVEKTSKEEKVEEACELPTTQNEHLYDQSSEALLRQVKI
jgi:transposase